MSLEGSCTYIILYNRAGPAHLAYKRKSVRSKWLNKTHSKPSSTTTITYSG